jgi:hypothetical protein
MATAIMTGTLPTGHKAHSDPSIFSADITVFFSFGFWHFFSPSRVFRQSISKKVRPQRFLGWHSEDKVVGFPIMAPGTKEKMVKKSRDAPFLK